MKVRIKAACTAVQGKMVKAGDVVDCPDQYAQSLIAANVAEPFSETAPKKSPEPVVQEPAEKVTRKAKKAAPENK